LIFNMVKRVEGQHIWKYIGKWEQTKADKIIDASEKVGLGKKSDKQPEHTKRIGRKPPDRSGGRAGQGEVSGVSELPGRGQA